MLLRRLFILFLLIHICQIASTGIAGIDNFCTLKFQNRHFHSNNIQKTAIDIFGISPAGNINNNYYDLYADVALWGSSSGFMDYCMPQIYFGYEHNTLDYIKCLNDWKRTVTNSGIDLVIGLGAYKIGLESDGGSDEWSRDTTILKRQVQDARSGLGGRYKGFCMFDYESFFSSASLNTAQRNNLKPVI